MADDVYVGEDEKATLSKRRGQYAATKTGSERKQAISAQGDAEARGKGKLSRLAYNRLSTEAALGGFRKGGKVKKTGTYRLHKNERVLTAKQAKKFYGAKG